MVQKMLFISCKKSSLSDIISRIIIKIRQRRWRGEIGFILIKDIQGECHHLKELLKIIKEIFIIIIIAGCNKCFRKFHLKLSSFQ